MASQTPTAMDFLVDSIRNSNLSSQSKKLNSKFPCGICKFEVKHNHKAIFCTNCDSWVHIKCDGTSIEDYKIMMKNNRDNDELIENEIWECLNCIINQRAIIFPFGLEDNLNLRNLNTLNTKKLIDTVPQFKIVQEDIKYNNNK